jgi:hypothetical protein
MLQADDVGVAYDDHPRSWECSFGRLLGLNPFEVRLEGIETSLPAPFLVGDLVDEFVRRARLQSTGPALGIYPLADKPRSLEDPDVFGDRLQADGKRLGQLFYRCLTHKRGGSRSSGGSVLVIATEVFGRRMGVYPVVAWAVDGNVPIKAIGEERQDCRTFLEAMPGTRPEGPAASAEQILRGFLPPDSLCRVYGEV